MGSSFQASARVASHPSTDGTAISTSCTIAGATKKLASTISTAVTGLQVLGLGARSDVSLEESFDIDNCYKDDQEHQEEEACAHNTLLHLLAQLFSKQTG